MTEAEAHGFYMGVAEKAASLSYCNRRKVGAVVVKDDNIISYGFNGTLPGAPNVCEGDDGITLPGVVHAEANAILKLAASPMNATGSTMYLTLSPCVECAKMIIRSGVKKVVFQTKYRNTEGLNWLEDSNVEVIQDADYAD